MKNKTLIVLAIFILGTVTFSSAQTPPKQADFSQQAQTASPKPKSPEYVPGEVLVKFKEGVDPQAVLQAAKLDIQSIGRIHSIKPVVARFKKDAKLEKSSDGWYWFLGKKYKEVAAISDEILFQQAYQKMPETEKSLYRSYKITLSKDTSVEEAVRRLSAMPEVEWAEPNRIVRINSVPDDPYYSSQGSWGQDYDDLWGLKKIEVDKAWEISQGEGVVVAVIDTGVDYNHEDLTEDANGNGILDASEDQNGNGILDSNIWTNEKNEHGWNFVANNNNPMDDHGHGTHSAGIIAARKDNLKGIIGVAPKAKIMCVKGLSSTGGGADDKLAEAIIYAAQNGAKVLSNSWGGDGNLPQALKEAIDFAHNNKKCVVVFAAGNDSDDVSDYYPGGYKNVITVAASDPSDQKCDFSNYGEGIDVAAPGGGSAAQDGPDGPVTYKLGRNILSLRAAGTDMYGADDVKVGLPAGICFIPCPDTGARYYRSRGTSMACPFVSGAAALVLAKYPEYSPEQVKSSLCLSADDLGTPGKDAEFGYGRVNARNVLNIGNLHLSIESPSSGIFVRGRMPIQGGVFVENGIVQGYELYYAPQDTPQEKKIIVSKSGAGAEGLLADWDTTGVADGKYILTLKTRFKLFLNGQYVEKEYFFNSDVIVDNVNSPAQLVVKLSNPGYFLPGHTGVYFNHCPNVEKRILLPLPTFPGQAVYELSINDELDDHAYWADTPSLSVDNIPLDWEFRYDSARQKWTINCFSGFSTPRTQKLALTIHEGRLTTKKEIYVSWVDISQEILSDIPPSAVAKNNRIFWVENNQLQVFDLASREKKAFIIPSGFKISHLGRDSIATSGDFVVVGMYDVNDEIGLYCRYLYLYSVSRPQDAPRCIYSGETGTTNNSLSFDNGKIAWSNSYYDSSNPLNNHAKIIIFDLAVNTHKTIYSVDGGDTGLFPCFDKETLIFVKQEGDNRILTSYAGGKFMPLTRIFSSGYTPIRVHNNRVVYRDIHELYKTNELYLYDLLAGEKRKLTDNWAVIEWEPEIYNDKIVWFDDMPLSVFESANGYNIWLYDDTNKQAIRLVYDEYLAFMPYPVIFENTVIYRKGTRYDIRGHGMVVVRFQYTPMSESVSPEITRGGGQVIIKGRDFGKEQGAGKVVLANGVVASIRSWSDIQITCIVPTGAISGEVKVVTEGGASNAVILTIDNDKPEINNIVVQQAKDGKKVDFSAKITDTSSGVKQAILYWYERKAMNWKPQYKEIPMSAQGSDTYKAVLNSESLRKIPTTVYYYLAAQDNAGNWKYTPTYSLQVTSSNSPSSASAMQKL